MASTTNNTASTKRVLTDVNAASGGVAKKPKKVKSITKKEINEKMRYASKSELSSLLTTIIQDYPEASSKVLDEYTPDNAPTSTGDGTPPTAGQALKQASTKAKKNKVLKDAFKQSDEKSLKNLVNDMIEQIPELKQVNGMIHSFDPDKMPLKPSPNDPLLQQCFICHSTDAELQDFYDIKVCACCDLNSGKHGGTLTRDRVMSYFHFTKSEADKIPRKKSTGGMYRSLIYVYNVKSVANAAKKKYGSLYNMVKSHTPSYMYAT